MYLPSGVVAAVSLLPPTRRPAVLAHRMHAFTLEVGGQKFVQPLPDREPLTTTATKTTTTTSRHGPKTKDSHGRGH